MCVCTHFVLENESQKIVWNFKIQIDQPNLHRRPDLVLINKKRTFSLVNFTIPAEHRMKKQKYRQMLGSCYKAAEHVVPIIVGALGSISKETERTEDQRKN